MNCICPDVDSERAGVVVERDAQGVVLAPVRGRPARPRLQQQGGRAAVQRRAAQVDGGGCGRRQVCTVHILNAPAWSWIEVRKEWYLHQYGADQPDLDFNKKAVVQLFSAALRKWMEAGAGGVRSVLCIYERAGVVVERDAQGVEEGDRPELFLLERPNATRLRPASSAPLSVADVTAAASQLNERIKGRWPLLQVLKAAKLSDHAHYNAPTSPRTTRLKVL
ncbi:Neutral and basic amino acid transport protein rBAT [Operophtera brumata]|uniref:alpha-glucosidase n=1 Tax=Operophtera brumata TaxID=104452 RepID=A0A0L7LUJ1_OPEBR|nr:Neutral and basic amino acid transport protein rBAT [Operophtera brumata]